jgi:hypothetical protein
VDLPWLDAIGEDATGLRHAPDLHERKAEALLEGGVQLRLDTGADAEADPVRPLLGDRGLVEEQRRHDAEVVQRGRARGHHVGPPAPRAEALGQDEAARGEDGARARDAETVHVKEGEGIDDPVAAGFDGHAAAEIAVPGAGIEHVEVAEHAALGPPGRAGGVEERALRVQAGRARARRGPRLRQGARPRAHVDHGQGPRALPPHRREGRRALRHRHREVRVGVGHLIGELVVAIVGVHGHDARPQRVQGEIVKEHLRAVLEQERHAMPVPVAGGGVGLAEAERLGPRLSIADLHAVGMIGAAGRRRHTEEGVVGRRRRRRHEGLEDRAHDARL